MPARAHLIALPLVAALLATACSTAKGGGAGAAADSVTVSTPAPGPAPAPRADVAPDNSPAAADTAGEQARITRLERDARALARAAGCTRADDCRSAPVGARPCGGPRSYITYCAASTDTVALFAKLRALETAEKAYNERSGMMGTCEFRTPPGVSLVGGSCRETAGAGAGRMP